MSNLIELQSQIEALQKQANEIRAKEFDATVQDILAKMSAFGISLKDLQSTEAGKSRKGVKAGKFSSAGKPGRPAKSGSSPSVTSDRAIRKNAGVAVAAKFVGPNGETWSGRGLMPRWMSALVTQGQTKEDFAIKPA